MAVLHVNCTEWTYEAVLDGCDEVKAGVEEDGSDAENDIMAGLEEDGMRGYPVLLAVGVATTAV